MSDTPHYEHPGCPEEQLELLEPYLDGELAPDSAARVEAHLEECASCRLALEEARQVRDGLRSLPTAECPQHVVDAVLSVARSEKSAARPNVLTPSGGFGTKRTSTAWLAAAAALLIAAVAGTWLFDRLGPGAAPAVPAQATLSSEELERAEEEARLALALFAEVSDRVGRIVQEEVIVRRVSAAPTQALEVLRARTEVSR